MLPDPSTPTKSPKGAERPFPWQCRHCGKIRVVPTRTDYPLNIRYDGRLVSFVAYAVDIPTCQDCSEKIITMEVDDQVNAAFRKHLGLLAPEQIQEGIERLGISQKEVAQRLGIEEDTLSRWANNMIIQPRAMDNYLRMFFRFPEVRAILSAPPIESIGTINVPDPTT